MSDDHVIKHLDLENPGSFVEPPSQAEIRFARARVSGRMIVLCGRNCYVLQCAYRAGLVGLGVVWIDQPLYIVKALFFAPLLEQL